MRKITTKEFNQLATYIHEEYGIYLRPEKKELLIARLHKIMEQQGFKNYDEYYKYILNDKTGKGQTTLVNQITTNYTFFMREAQHFKYFKEVVLPFWKRNIGDGDLRVWCAACATGEEAYTLAILIYEAFAMERQVWDTKLLATDLSLKALEHAKKGIYEVERMKELPLSWRTRYFKKLDKEQYMAKEMIKQEIIYRRFNLMEAHFPFKRKFHVIFCRNVMIYFDEPTRQRLLKKLYDSLEWGGYLFIGQSESINCGLYGFKHIMPAVYQKN